MTVNAPAPKNPIPPGASAEVLAITATPFHGHLAITPASPLGLGWNLLRISASGAGCKVAFRLENGTSSPVALEADQPFEVEQVPPKSKWKIEQPVLLPTA